MLDFLELEETVGRAWHRLVGATASYPVHPGQAVSLAELQGRIAVIFRALGGEAGVQIAGSNARKSGHRLGWRQRIGLGDESLDHPGRDAATVFLPDRIAIFSDRDLLFYWHYVLRKAATTGFSGLHNFKVGSSNLSIPMIQRTN